MIAPHWNRRALLGLAALAAAGVRAQAEPDRLHGFRSARFGMAEADLRKAIARDFGVPVTAFDNAAQRTRVLSVSVPALEPGPGPGTVSYILGANSRRLVHVNVGWTGGPTDAERDRLAAAALLLANHFRARDWPLGGAAAGVREPPDTLVLFAGVDGHGASVEVRLSGVPLAGADGKVIVPAVSNRAELRVVYAANAVRPDIVPLARGAF